MLRGWVGLIGMFALVTACRKAEAPPPLVVDDAVWMRVLPKIDATFARPAVDAAFETLMSGVFDDPALVLAGTGLLTDLAADPKIGAPVEDLLGKLGDSEAMQAEVTRLMAAHPEASAEEIGDLVGQRFEEVFSSPQVSAAFNAAFNLYLAKMRARPEGARVHALFAGIADPVIDAARLAKWSHRLEVLEGKRLEGRAAQDAYLRHAWSDARIEGVATALANNTALQRLTAQALAEVLALPSLRGDLKTAAVALLADEPIRDGILATMLLLAEAQPPIATIRLALADLLTKPALIDASGVLVGRVLANPDVRRIVGRWFAQVRADPSIRGEIDKFLDGW